MDYEERSVTKCWEGGEIPWAKRTGTEEVDSSEGRNNIH